MLGEFLSLGCALVWGVSVILFKQSESVSAQAMNLFKNTIGLALLLVTMLVLGGSPPVDRSPEDWVRLIVSGVLGLAVADTLFLEALRRLGAGMLSILDCLYAPLVSLFSVFLLGEELGRGFALGAGLVIGGLLIATTGREELREAAHVAREHFGAVAIGLASIAFMALGIVLAKPVLEHSELVEATSTRLAAGTGALALYILFRRDRKETFRVLVPNPSWRRLLPAAFLGTYVAMLLWLGGMKYVNASTGAVLNQLSVLFTLLLARVVLKERLSFRKLVGGGASLAGAIVVLLAT